ncbi:MBOAT family O-acyltransferase [Methylobacter marinus]|uniref:MBOAT family O-acyltransferase n=1 Tax=Methylobacter marinus TaxID=34058 RepID=UPI00036EB99D|nr:MBOAT family protein [Methylobacter marinus]
MLFVSQTFLFAFLPIVLALYYLTPSKYRNWVLLCFSWIFYTWDSGKFILILILTTIVNYAFGLLIDRSLSKKKWWVFFAIAFNLSILAYFKYANFFVSNVNNVITNFGLSPIKWTDVLLPIGISFFVFHNITYVVDVYRGTKRAFRNFIDIALYIAFFPQLIAGPIVRFHEISDQLRSRKETLESFYYGVIRFCWGLMKKMVLANSCAEIADTIFALPSGTLDTKFAWMGAFAYALQIYFDFSGYTDMAVGLGHMFGFKLPENFNRPYSATSITDFWRRWHISLSNFFRDYLYIPLGGNRKGTVRTLFNLITVFILCGLWHGANWTFLMWGVYHGSLLMVERLALLSKPEGTLKVVLRRVVTFILIIIGWVLFRSTNLEQAMSFLQVMFVPININYIPLQIATTINSHNIFFLFLASLVVFMPQGLRGYRILLEERGAAIALIQGFVLVIGVLYSISLGLSGSYNPFIYFQF